MKAKKYNGGGKMEESGAEVEIKSMDLMEAVKQLQAAVKAGSKMPTHYKVKACFYEDEE
jgi:hypothetical protein